MPKMPKKIIVNKTIAIPETLQFIIRQTRFTQEDTNNFRRLLLPVNQTNENQFIERPNWPWTHFHNQRLGLYNNISQKERAKLRTYHIQESCHIQETFNLSFILCHFTTFICIISARVERHLRP